MTPKHLPQRLTREEAQRLLAIPNRRAPTGVRNRAILRVLYRGGLRCAEALALTPRDIQFSRDDRGEVNCEIRVNRGKGDKDRVVWAGDPLTVEILEQWRAIRPSSPWFFCALFGENIGAQLDSGYVRAMVARYGRRAQLDIRAHPHLLRHTFASELLEEGYTVAEVQKLLGHSDLGTTQLYLHLVDERLRERLAARTG
jgi:integrase/recombinase XerD